jgi:hypothetical protein
VIFSTTSESNHGNPQPVNHPERTPRRSIALYYYTATWNNTKRKHTTQFRVRPGNTNDAPDLKSKGQDVLGDVMPPVLYRKLANLSARRARR